VTRGQGQLAGVRGFVRAVAEEAAKDKWIYAAMIMYAFAAIVLAAWLPGSNGVAFTSYVSIWMWSGAAIAVFYVLLVELPLSFCHNPSDPLVHLISRLPVVLNPRLVAGGVLIVGLSLTMGCFTSVKNMLVAIAPFHWDVRLAHLDSSLHVGRDPWVLLQPLLGHHVITRLLQHIYLTGWAFVLVVGSSAVAVSKRLEHLRQRFFLTYLFCWIVLGNVAAGVFMSAGPAYYGAVTGDESRFASQLSYLSFSAGLPSSSVDLQRVLWTLYRAGRAELGSGISAFPSVHIAMATLFALLGWRVNRATRIVTLSFLAIMQISSVHLAWHYAIDGYASALATTLAWYTIGRVENRRRSAGERSVSRAGQVHLPPSPTSVSTLHNEGSLPVSTIC